MRKIILTTESGADLPIAFIERYNLEVVPMHVIMDGKDYLDGSLPITDIYDYYERTKKVPSTTSTNPNEYTELFTKIRAAHPDSIIVHIGYTSKASSSFQNANIAAADFEDIHLIDALNVSGGLTAVVMYAAFLLEKEPDIELDRFLKLVQNSVPRARFAFLPENLDFLRAGGRVSNAAYIGASLLKIKPLIELVDGKLVSTKKYRGKMIRVAEDLMQDFLKLYPIDREHVYLILSVGLDESIKMRMEKLARENGFKNVTWVQTGGVITSHGGPGAFGIAGMEIEI